MEGHTDLKVVLVRQRILNRLNKSLASQNLLRHLVHGVLHAGAVILSEGLEGDLTGRLPGSVKVLHISAHLVESREALPAPSGIDIRAEDAVPGLLESGVLVADEAPELRVGALQHGQVVQRGADVDALALDHVNLDIALLLPVAHERVRVRLAVDRHARPAVRDDLGVRGVNVRILRDEVCAQDRAEQLGGSYWVLAR